MATETGTDRNATTVEADRTATARPSFPTGWFEVARTDELDPGAVVERTFLGERVVVFRTESGRFVVADAHCPHMGANLARGGTVVGESLRCPFHTLRWGVDGTCVGSEYPGDPPYPSTLAVHRTIERFGSLFAWNGPDGMPPAFDIPELEREGWTDFRATTFEIECELATVLENGADTAHFGCVHGFELSGGAVEDRGHSFHSEFHFATPNFLREGPPELVTFFDTDLFGPGYSRSDNRVDSVGLHYRVLLMTTPITAGLLRFTAATTVERPAEGDRIAGVPVDDVADLMHRGTLGGIEQDIPIWEGVRRVHDLRLVKGDGPIPRLRRWLDRFYEAPGGPAPPA